MFGAQSNSHGSIPHPLTRKKTQESPGAIHRRSYATQGENEAGHLGDSNKSNEMAFESVAIHERKMNKDILIQPM